MTRIDHVGIAVNDLEAATAFFKEKLRLPLKEVKELPDRGLRMAIFEVGETLVELMTPMSPDSQVSKFLAKRGEGFHHVAFSTPDLQAHIDDLVASGVEMTSSTPTIGAEGRPIAFLHPKGSFGVLTELIEKE
jgi:methylmalonyl-CoA/ethylmalonyl-CoA epimerase